MSLRSIPLRDHGERIGAIVLCRDVTELRHQERELITKDATIREIHHRVKNNLQTVASLLRIQARRTHSDEARDVAAERDAPRRRHRRRARHPVERPQPERRLRRGVRLACSSSSPRSRRRTTPPCTRRRPGEFGVLPSEAATPLALGAHRARDERRRARAGRPRRRGRDRRPPLRRPPESGPRQRRGPARGQGRLGPRHADRPHAHPGRARRHHRLAHAHRAAAPR